MNCERQKFARWPSSVFGTWPAVALVLLATAACDGSSSFLGPTRQAVPQADLSDGAHGGNSHFFFLPPLLPSPSFSGDFDSELSPEVIICELPSCGVIAIYTTESGTGSETVRVVLEEEHYIVNWHTDEFTLDPTKTYRIAVSVGARELGYVDVDVVTGGSEVKNVDTNEYIALVNERTLPIKFRIEKGALVGDFATVSAGGYHSCGLTPVGTAYCWGDNSEGQLGNGSTSSAAVPIAVSGGFAFATLTTGYGHTCGLANAGAGYCWGSNNLGELGAQSAEVCAGLPCSTTPVAISGGHTFTVLSAGESHTCGITTNQVAYCWGFNFYGQLGNGSTGGFTTTPTVVVGSLAFRTISAGERHTCGLTTEGFVYCWGFGFYGQLGNGSTNNSSVPVQVSTNVEFASIHATTNGHTCGLTVAGSAYCWGRNDSGQLGNGSSSDISAPAPVFGGLTIGGLAASYSYTCGVTTTGAGYCWGVNNFGQLGNGSGSSSTVPVAISGDLLFLSIGASNSLHTCGITTGVSTYCWGRGTEGQLGNGSAASSTTPVAVLGPS